MVLEQASPSKLVIDGLMDFVDKEVVPLQHGLGEFYENPRLRYDSDGRENRRIADARKSTRMASARAGYYHMFCPAEIGGAAMGEILFFLCWEELHHRHGPGELLAYNTISHWTSGPSAIWQQASPSTAGEILPRLMSGELQGCFGMSEPDAGSDAWRMKTAAKRDGDTWLLNGSKQWTSFSPSADFVLTFAVSNPELAEARKGGITCFYVPASSPGFAVDSIIRLFGEVGGREGILSFDNVRVPDEFRIGEQDRGFALAMLGVTQGRLYNTARSVGLSRWALERSIAYSKSRHTFGKPIAEHQSIQNMLADCAVDIYAAKMMGLDCADKAQRGLDVRREAAMAKLYATNAATRVFDRAMQVHGGLGVTNELRLYEGWQTARIIRIADGTDEILRRTIATELARGNVAF